MPVVGVHLGDIFNHRDTVAGRPGRLKPRDTAQPSCDLFEEIAP